MNYPFAAIVGQEKLKRALLLTAINPGIGGVLIRGEKGTAKSTAARALAEIVPPIVKIADCPFNCAAGAALGICGVCQQPGGAEQEMPVPFVNLPIGATEDRVLGSLDLEGVLTDRKKRLQPGLLASAHQGILYIDEVNLLPDHLIDVLLDVAAMGVNSIQREGLSVSHPARFSLIGTMNPEEGNLRPQFLDRFGLMVEVEAPRNVAERTEIVRRRMAFETSPTAFVSQWEAGQKVLQQQLLSARQLLSKVTLPDGLLTLISQLCTELEVTSLRADIVMYKTALTLAALANRTEVTAADIRQAAELVLGHRGRKKPFSDNPLNEEKLNQAMEQASAPGPQPAPKPTPAPPENNASPPTENMSASVENTSPAIDEAASAADGSPTPLPAEEQTFGATPVTAVPAIQVKTEKATQHTPTGRRSVVANAPRGNYTWVEPNEKPTDLAVEATVYHALQRNPLEIQITRQDLHQKVRTGKSGNLILFVVDASGSMAASRRMEAVKGAVMSLLTDAYQRRDTVGVITFRGIAAQVLLEPTRSVELAEQALRNLPTGGRTPLPHALQLSIQVLDKFKGPADLRPLLVILSDGKANVALPVGGDPWSQTLTLASQLKNMAVPALVLDSENNYLQVGKAGELARYLGGQHLAIQDLSTEALIPIVNKVC